MDSMRDSFLLTLKPHTAVKIENLDGKEPLRELPTDIIKSIHSTLTYKYKTFLDIENGVIYVGKRI